MSQTIGLSSFQELDLPTTIPKIQALVTRHLNSTMATTLTSSTKKSSIFTLDQSQYKIYQQNSEN